MNELNLMPEMSEKFDIVMKQFAMAKKEMGCTVTKDSINPHFKNRYASLGAYLEIFEDSFEKAGLMLLQNVNGTVDKPVLIATIFHVESGQWIKSYMPLPNPKQDSQGLGSSITYMRRYSISCMMGLNAEDDDGEASASRPAPQKKEKEPKEVDRSTLTNAQVKELEGIEKKITSEYKLGLRARWKKTYGADNLSDILEDDYPFVLQTYKNALKFSESTEEVKAVAHA